MKRLVGALATVMAFMVGACGSSQPPQVASSPTPDQVLVAYRSAADQGWEPLFRHWNTWGTHCQPKQDEMRSPVQCRADSVQLKADARGALGLLAGVATKPGLEQPDQDLKRLLGEVATKLDLLIASIDAGDVPAVRDTKFRVSRLLADAWFAVNTIDCWPLGIRRNGAEAPGGFSTCVSPSP